MTRTVLAICFVLMIILTGCGGKPAMPAPSSLPPAQAPEVSEAAPAETPEPVPSEAPVDNQEPGTVKMICSFMESAAAGILLADDGSLFVGVPRKLYKVSPDGKKSLFSDFSDIADVTDHTFESPFIWDMYFDGEGNIIAAAQDRILKIDPEGKAETVFKYDFTGFCGTSGITTDKDGNIYITSGSQILKFNRQFEDMEVFIDGAADGSHSDIFSIHFSPDYKALYVTEFSNQTLVRYTIDEQGNAVDRKNLDIDFQMLSNTSTGNTSSPLDLIFDESGGMYVSLDYTRFLAKISDDGEATPIPLDDPTIKIHMITFDHSGESIYLTTCAGNLYKYKLP
jgi:DNA-binding beta-propeller fold protein YncE